VDIESCVVSAENLLHKGKADELFPEKQREDLVGEDILDNLVMETTNMVEGTIRGCASFCHQTVNVRMEIDAVSKGLDHGHYSRHKLKACGCVQEFHKCAHRRETEIIEELSLETEEKTQHLGNGEDNLTVKDIQEKFIPHPFAPFLPAFGVTRRTESACLAGKHQEPLFPTVRAPDSGKATHRIAAVEITLDHLLDYRTEIAVLLLEPILIFSKEPLKIIKEHPIEYSMFRMTLAIDPCHGREDDSRNGPGSRKEPQRPNTPGMLQA
jgi:hypothetical protein